VIECNFPELLVRDLEVSKEVFTMRAMTAGYPAPGCEAPSIERTRPSQRAASPILAAYSRTPFYRNPLFAMAIAQTNHEDLFFGPSEVHSGPTSPSPDSASIMSSTMAPPSIRTSAPSVTVGATSVSDCCSSVFSHNTMSPASPIASPCSSNGASSLRGRWHEDRTLYTRDGPLVSPGLTDRSSIYDSQDSAMCFDDDYEDGCSYSKKFVDPQKPRNLSHAADIHTRPVEHSRPSSSETGSRPHTPSSPMLLGKARIVDVPPYSSGTPKQESSATAKNNNSNGETSANSITNKPRDQGIMSRDSVEVVQQKPGDSTSQRPPEEPLVHVPFLTTPSGRTLVDASGAPSVELEDEAQLFFNEDSSRSYPVSIGDEAFVYINKETIIEERSGKARGSSKPLEPTLRSWLDVHSAVPTSNPTALRDARQHFPTLPVRGIRLPPEVVESLRVSISCFPETMLQTSSLSIETIRTYSRKLKYRAEIDRLAGLQHDQYSTSNMHETKSAKRWHFWPGQSRRTKPDLSSQPPHCHTFPRKSRSSSIQSTTSITQSSHNFTQPPCWAVIKAIFPAATDYICDALYAHLVAYNYISSLCSPSPASPPQSPKPSLRAVFSNPNATSNLHIDEPPAWVPLKAASLLGMNDPSTLNLAYHKHLRQQGQAITRPRTRKGLLVRRPLTPVSEIFSNISPISYSISNGSTVTGTGCGSGSGGNPPSTSEDSAMRELRLGLRSCIHMLIATIKKGSLGCVMRFTDTEIALGGGSGTGFVSETLDKESMSVTMSQLGDGMEEVTVDPALVRALCEVVRCTEEGFVGSSGL